MSEITQSILSEDGSEYYSYLHYAQQRALSVALNVTEQGDRSLLTGANSEPHVARSLCN
jgi:hypothetical protein